MHRSACFGMLLLLGAPRALASGPGPLVAVSGIHVRGLALRRPARAALEQALRSELLATKRFRLVPAERVEQQLREEKGRCARPACLLHLAQKLDADQVLQVALERKGRVCALTGTLYHVVRGVVVRGGTARGACAEPGLQASIQTVVAKLAGTWNKNDPCSTVLVTAGTFVRGIAADDRPWSCCRKAGQTTSDGPPRQIYLDWYYIDRHEVTVSQYRRCVKTGACAAPPGNPACNHNHADRGDHPVNCATWHQARAYCAWAGKRLPTEAEWEKAARGTDGRRYPWGNEPPSCHRVIMAYAPKRYRPPGPAWPKHGLGCGRGTTWPVASRSPAGDSPYGVQDMAGNVREWVWDWFHETYYRRSPRSNPRGPSRGTRKVVRGGSYTYDGGPIDSNGPGFWLLATSRGGHEPKESGAGFRCAMTP